MTRNELFDFVNNIMTELVNNKNKSMKNKGKVRYKFFYTIEPAVGNGATVTLKAEWIEKMVNEAGEKYVDREILKVRSETVYAIQGYNIIDCRLWKSFSFYLKVNRSIDLSDYTDIDVKNNGKTLKFKEIPYIYEDEAIQSPSKHETDSENDNSYDFEDTDKEFDACFE